MHLGGTPDDFFQKLERKAHTFPTWHGELYFELHRGTYTTQAQTKLNNRRAEFLLRDVEFLATVTSLEFRSYKYPKKEIDEMWEGVLLCQFHDCLPGTAIGMCYDDSDKVRRLQKLYMFLKLTPASRSTRRYTAPPVLCYRMSTRFSKSAMETRPRQPISYRWL